MGAIPETTNEAVNLTDESPSDDLDLGEEVIVPSGASIPIEEMDSEDFEPPEEINTPETADEVEEPYGPLAALDALANSYISHQGDLKRLPHIGTIVVGFINNRQNIVDEIHRNRVREKALERTFLTNTYTVD